MYTRKQTKKIRIGNLTLGGDNQILIQSMTNTATKNITDTVQQILVLESLGCDIIRVAVLDQEDATAITSIKKQIHIPIVADIHFDYRLAILAIEHGADKIRINPGNIGSMDKLEKVVQACKQNDIPIRIGINGGSLEKDLEEKFGPNNPEAIYASAKRNIQLLESLGFGQIVVSLKSSDLLATIKAYHLLAQEYDYPLHIGITEAGTLLTSSIRSSAGLGILLYEGLGNTLRISITGDPKNEIIVAKELLHSLGLYSHPYPKMIACPTCGRTHIDVEKIADEVNQLLHTMKKNITVAVMGCIVNGIGESKHADIGIAGGNKEAILFKKGRIIRKVPEEDLIRLLKEEIEKM